MVRRRLGERVRWYAYLAVTPFDGELASLMRRAGCAGINFTGDSASEAVLSAYRQPHRKDDLAAAIRHCRGAGITVMIDLLLGGPGETPQTVVETVDFLRASASTRGPLSRSGCALGGRWRPCQESSAPTTGPWISSAPPSTSRPSCDRVPPTW